MGCSNDIRPVAQSIPRPEVESSANQVLIQLIWVWGQKLIVIIKHVQIAKATSLLPNIFGVWGWGGFGLLVTTI